ncbi:MAG: hypothetical protein GF417_10625 [Candidatus Latescibacteria bacterium]|nr:hypothetical protein [bacterium]MBD3424881.1 hypothetical protein [Candidatus Latescibacterota bacterium]
MPRRLLLTIMHQDNSENIFLSEGAIIVYLVTAKLAIHLALPGYGYFRDELYYLSIGERFSLSNLDMPPLTPLYARLITSIFGYSVKALYAGSALCGALSMVIACRITGHPGGKRYAVLLTGIFMLLSGFLIFGSLFTYDSIDFMLQVTAIYILVRIINDGDQKLWVLFGLVAGIGLLNKMSMLLLGLAVFLALWLVPARRSFRQKWIWIGGAAGLLFSIPFIIWQSRHGWYYLDFALSYRGGLAYAASFPEFVWSQILPDNPLAFPVWLGGLILLLFSSGWKRFRFFGFLYLVIFSLAFFLGVKFYFLIPVYSILLATGAVGLESWLERRGAKSLFLKPAIPAGRLLLSLPLLPLMVPLLPVEEFAEYAARVGIHAGVRHENSDLGRLPQHMADRNIREGGDADILQKKEMVVRAVMACRFHGPCGVQLLPKRGG